MQDVDSDTSDDDEAEDVEQDEDAYATTDDEYESVPECPGR